LPSSRKLSRSEKIVEYDRKNGLAFLALHCWLKGPVLTRHNGGTGFSGKLAIQF
jgi:hypothetical protein